MAGPCLPAVCIQSRTITELQCSSSRPQPTSLNASTPHLYFKRRGRISVWGQKPHHIAEAPRLGQSISMRYGGVAEMDVHY
ncbi:unnamed protein product [Leuciscus chuanchicus]